MAVSQAVLDEIRIKHIALVVENALVVIFSDHPKVEVSMCALQMDNV